MYMGTVVSPVPVSLLRALRQRARPGLRLRRGLARREFDVRVI